MRTDVYQKITDRIVAELEQGVRPWLKPWSAGNTEGRIMRPLRANGIPYQGINVLMLWSEAIEKGSASPMWMTFKQALDLKANVRKGEHGSLVVYADKIIRTETDRETGEEAERAIPFMKGYTVFNVEQIEGLPEHYYAKPAPRGETVRRIERAESFFAATGATVRHGGTMACYVISQDHVRMPHIEALRDAESYYATLAHKMSHWTRHPSRLDRDFGRKRFGDKALRTGGPKSGLVAGTAYPALQMKGVADNVAIWPAFVDSCLTIKSVRYVLVEKADEGLSYTLLNLAIAHTFDNGKINWQETDGPDTARRTHLTYENGLWISRDGDGRIYNIH